MILKIENLFILNQILNIYILALVCYVTFPNASGIGGLLHFIITYYIYIIYNIRLRQNPFLHLSNVNHAIKAYPALISCRSCNSFTYTMFLYIVFHINS